MNINTLIILGENGMLGNYIKKYFQNLSNINVIPVNRNMFNAYSDNILKLELLLNNYFNENTLVFNAIGVIPQSSKNNVITDNHYIKINTEFPHELALLCNKYKMKLIHPTTDCVFSGSKGKYIETDEHDEVSTYGQSKSLGEPKLCTVIRTSIIGEEINNNISLVSWIKQNNNKEINGYKNHYWNGITCLQYAKIIEYMINNNIFWEGVKHIYSPNTVSKYELCYLVSDAYKLNIKINDYETTNIIDKSLSTIHKENNIFCIPNLKQQIIEMKDFSNILHKNC